MNDTPPGDAAPAPDAAGAAPPLRSRADWFAALQWGFATAWARRARRIVCCDADFADWPLDDPALLQGLTAWLRMPGRQLVLLARDYADVPRRHPRFTGWRANWTHAVDAWLAPTELAPDLPTALLADATLAVQLFDAVHWRGRAVVDDGRAHVLASEVDAVLQRSERAFPAHPLGL